MSNKVSNKVSNRMHIFKKIFFILLVLDCAGLILVGIDLFPTFKQLSGYGQPMISVISVMIAVVVAIQLFEIIAKFFLMKSTSPAFSWSSGRKGYIAAAKLLLLFNFGSIIVNLLSAGGEGATLINQLRLYMQILLSSAEIIVVFCYLRTVKKFFMSIKEDND